MNSEKARKSVDNLYLRGAQEVIRSISRLLGLPVNDETKKQIHRNTYSIVNRVRSLAAGIAYRDYTQVVGSDPIPQVPLNRFTPGLWQSSIDSATQDEEFVTASVTEEIGMSADYWARDAEWGERLQLARQDTRVGRIARVDFEPPTCSFCALMNSRGPVYVNKDSFLRTLHTGDTCSAVFVSQGDTEYPGMEHTAEALRRYKEAVQQVGPHQGANVVMAAMKEQHPYEGPGKVRQNAKQAAEKAANARKSQVQKIVSSLENAQPKTPSGKSVRDDQLARNKQILNVLETVNG